MPIADSSNTPRPPKLPSAWSAHAAFSIEAGFVWLVWTTMLAIALAAVYSYASRIPYQDEWNAIVPAMTGQRPITLAWLWTPHNEHRLFLPRLIDLGLLKLSGGDFRIGSYFNLALLALMAAGSICAAQQIRGKPSFTDAIFPLLLLHLRHFENILMMFQNQVVVPVGCTLVALFAAARYSPETTKSGALLVWCGAALLSIPLCGAYGLPIAFPSTMWLAAVAGFRYRRDPSDKRSLIALTVAMATLAICVAYLVGLKRTEPVASDLVTKFGFVVNLLRFSVGISEDIWLTVVQKSILLFVPLAIGLLVFRWMRAPADRARTAGVSAFFAGALAIPIAVASGRDPHLFPSRYFLHSALIPIGVYVVFLLVEKDNTAPFGRPFLTTVLFLAVLFLAVTSIAPLWKISADSMVNRLSFESGMNNEAPLPRLVAAYGDKLFLSREYLYGKVLDLCRERSGAFRDYRPDAEFTVNALMLSPATLRAYTWDDAENRQTEYPISWRSGAATISNSSGRPIQLAVAVGNPAPRQVRAIRIHYSMDVAENARATTGFNLRWIRPDDHSLASETEYLDSVWHPREQPLVLYIDDKIDAVSIVPLGPFRSVTISGIDLCLPVGELK